MDFTNIDFYHMECKVYSFYESIPGSEQTKFKSRIMESTKDLFVVPPSIIFIDKWSNTAQSHVKRLEWSNLTSMNHLLNLRIELVPKKTTAKGGKGSLEMSLKNVLGLSAVHRFGHMKQLKLELEQELYSCGLAMN